MNCGGGPVNLFDPTQWADIGGWFTLVAVSIATCVLVGVKIAGGRCEEWLEERLGTARDDVPVEVGWRRRI